MVYTRTGLPIITKQNKQTNKQKTPKNKIQTNNNNKGIWIFFLCDEHDYTTYVQPQLLKFSVAILNISFVNNFAKSPS